MYRFHSGAAENITVQNISTSSKFTSLTKKKL